MTMISKESNGDPNVILMTAITLTFTRWKHRCPCPVMTTVNLSAGDTSGEPKAWKTLICHHPSIGGVVYCSMHGIGDRW